MTEWEFFNSLTGMVLAGAACMLVLFFGIMVLSYVKRGGDGHRTINTTNNYHIYNDHRQFDNRSVNIHVPGLNPGQVAEIFGLLQQAQGEGATFRRLSSGRIQAEYEDGSAEMLSPEEAKVYKALAERTRTIPDSELRELKRKQGME